MVEETYNIDDRNETQRFAIVGVLMDHLEERLNSVVLERIMKEMLHALREGPCSWAFEPGMVLPSPDIMSASEALLGFAGWMTTLKELHLIGASEDTAFWAELVDEFCKAHGLHDPKEHWEKNLIYPEQLNLW